MKSHGGLRQLIRCWLRADEEIHRTLSVLIQEVRRIMPALDDLKAAVGNVATEVGNLGTKVGTIGTDVTTVASAIQALRDQIGSGGTVTDADLAPLVTSLNASADAIKASEASLATASTSLEAAAAAPPAP